jgi:imidazolonepropionase-like amidohydrolase
LISAAKRSEQQLRITWLKRGATALAVLLLALCGLFALGVWWPLDTVTPVRTTTPLAIVDATIVDVRNGQLVPAQTVVIHQDRITAVGPTAETGIPPTARVVDGGGRYLMPGLWDMHTHVYAISPMLDLPLYIAYGVTNVRDMLSCPVPGDPFISCPEDKRRWTAEALAGERVGPRIMGSASFMANGPVILDRMPDLPSFFGTATPEDSRAFVRHFSGKVDAIKVYNGIPRQSYFALTDEARRLGIDVVGHRPHAVSAVEAAANQKSIEHARFILHESFDGSDELRARGGTGSWEEDRQRMLDEHDPRKAEAIFAAMAREGTWYVPTHLTRWADAYANETSVREDPLLRYLHPLMKWQWLEDINRTLSDDPSRQARKTYRAFYRKGLELTGAAHRAGVKVLAGTDYIVAGADLHRELEQLVLAGLTPAEALYAATLAPAEYFGAQERFGSVTAGKMADLILLRANPLDDIRNTQRIESVIFNGNLYDRDKLDSISEHVKQRARSWAVACKILWRFITNPVAY